jgi:KaiC/GvpD/RAD55 family RecA-like ATPase
MRVRVVEVPPIGSGRLAALGREIRRLQEKGRSILYVSVERPAELVLAGLEAAGTDRQRIFLLDAVSSMSGARVSPDPDRILFVAGPDLLETLALRAEKVIRAKSDGPAHIIIDSVEAFSLYNDVDSLRQIVHYIINRLEEGVGLDFVVSPSSRVDADLLAFLGDYADETVQLK